MNSGTFTNQGQYLIVKNFYLSQDLEYQDEFLS